MASNACSLLQASPAATQPTDSGIPAPGHSRSVPCPAGHRAISDGFPWESVLPWAPTPCSQERTAARAFAGLFKGSTVTHTLVLCQTPSVHSATVSSQDLLPGAAQTGTVGLRTLPPHPLHHCHSQPTVCQGVPWGGENQLSFLLHRKSSTGTQCT